MNKMFIPMELGKLNLSPLDPDVREHNAQMLSDSIDKKVAAKLKVLIVGQGRGGGKSSMIAALVKSAQESAGRIDLLQKVLSRRGKSELYKVYEELAEQGKIDSMRIPYEKVELLAATGQPGFLSDEECIAAFNRARPQIKDYPEEPTWFPEPKQKYTASGKRKRR